MNKIFISYRRDDTKDMAGRIYDHLSSSFGKKNIFLDVDSIPFGVNFKKEIIKSITSCKLVLVVIGKKWLTLADSAGKRRVDNPDDYVRFEIETAIKNKIIIIPILIDDATIPSPKDLPDSIRSLHFNNTFRVNSESGFYADIEKLKKIISSKKIIYLKPIFKYWFLVSFCFFLFVFSIFLILNKSEVEVIKQDVKVSYAWIGKESLVGKKYCLYMKKNI